MKISNIQLNIFPFEYRPIYTTPKTISKTSIFWTAIYTTLKTYVYKKPSVFDNSFFINNLVSYVHAPLVPALQVLARKRVVENHRT